MFAETGNSGEVFVLFQPRKSLCRERLQTIKKFLMKKLIRLALGLSILLLAFPALAASKDSLREGFLGIRWGASADTLTDKTPLTQDDEPDINFFSSYRQAVGGITLEEVRFIFYKDQFSQALLFHKNPDELSAALTAEFGPPDIDSSSGYARWETVIEAEDGGKALAVVLPQQALAVAVNTFYFTQMLEALNRSVLP
jgi:hypothetical protein